MNYLELERPLPDANPNPNLKPNPNPNLNPNPDLEPHPVWITTGQSSGRPLRLCVSPLNQVCKAAVDLVCGTSDADNTTAIEDLTTHFPAGTSVKDVEHYEQFIGEIGSGEPEFFGRYNYGKELNREYYHQDTPPQWDLSLYNGPPVAFFAAGSDALVPPTAHQHLPCFRHGECTTSESPCCFYFR